MSGSQKKTSQSTDQVLLLSKKRTRKRCSLASWVICSPSFSTSKGGTGMGTPRWNTPSLGIFGSIICRWTMIRAELLLILINSLLNIVQDFGPLRCLCWLASHQGGIWRIASTLGPHQVQSFKRGIVIRSHPASWPGSTTHHWRSQTQEQEHSRHCATFFSSETDFFKKPEHSNDTLFLQQSNWSCCERSSQSLKTSATSPQQLKCLHRYLKPMRVFFPHLSRFLGCTNTN